MGSVALLSREGEIEIAKRIEEGKQDIAFGHLRHADDDRICPLRCGISSRTARSTSARSCRSQETEEEFEEEQVERDYEELRVKTLGGPEHRP